MLQKEIGQIKKAKGDASELLAKKAEFDKALQAQSAEAARLTKQRDQKAGTIGNLVHEDCIVSTTEVGAFAACPERAHANAGRQPGTARVPPGAKPQGQHCPWPAA